ncbi:hypothetical protein KC19_8G016600 [Ceratodon purpureus]|uniref:Uncharacterized protein n=1 Tax=Ceratodon purpureus TaxID=3225 RepID=A0A8T0GZQ2_CERPU|nr:hypothetical protein KC19_8G016600 [Ceratodon purpureus]
MAVLFCFASSSSSLLLFFFFFLLSFLSSFFFLLFCVPSCWFALFVLFTELEVKIWRPASLPTTTCWAHIGESQDGHKSDTDARFTRSKSPQYCLFHNNSRRTEGHNEAGKWCSTKSTTGVSVRNPDDQVTYPSSLLRSYSTVGLIRSRRLRGAPQG